LRARFDLLRVSAEGRRLFAVDLDLTCGRVDLSVAGTSSRSADLELLLDDRTQWYPLFLLAP